MLMEADLPEDVEALRAFALEQSRLLAEERSAAADLAVAKSEADAEIERLQSILDAFLRHRFGRKSEQLDPDQLQLGLEDIETALGVARAAREAGTVAACALRANRADCRYRR
jgi:transposase